VSKGVVVSIGGKTARRSYDKAKKKKPLHMVAAWVHENKLSLGQVVNLATGKESTEKRFYISSLVTGPKEFLTYIRRHWCIETS
jgi:predicted transposase YbfD/YdcC